MVKIAQEIQHIVGKSWTFEIKDLPNQAQAEQRNAINSVYSTYFDAYNYYLNIKGYKVIPYGDLNNPPLELSDLIEYNVLIRQMIAKKTKILTNEPYLYREIVENNEKKRIPIIDNPIQEWLESWEDQGFEPYTEYLQQTAAEYYTYEGAYTLFNRTQNQKSFAALQSLPNHLARLEAPDQNGRINRVLKANWRNPHLGLQISPVPTLNKRNAFAFPVAAEYIYETTVGKDFYSYPTWYTLKYWIRILNDAPQYISSFLENSLAAKFHIIIPSSWIAAKKELLEKICSENAAKGKESTPENPYPFTEQMLSDLIEEKVEQFISLVSGKENQGKAFVTHGYYNSELRGYEKWEIIAIDQKYKEFIDSMINIDKHALFNVTAGMGLPSAISNLTTEGNLSSGSEVLYAYLLYCFLLRGDEEKICRALNFAIKKNFPNEKGVKIGFFHNIPAKQEDTSPKDRTKNQNNT